MDTAKLQVVKAYFDAMARKDVSAAVALMTPNATWWAPGPGQLGIAQMVAFFGQVNQLIVNMTFAITGTTEQGDRVAIEATGDAELRNGKRYQNQYHALFEFRGDRISAIREYADSAPAQVFLS